MNQLEYYEKTLRSIKSPIMRKIFINTSYPLIPNNFTFQDPRK